MKSIQTRLIFVISLIMIVVVGAFLITSTIRTNTILDEDSDDILLDIADYYANVIDDNFRSTEQSVNTIYNYALKRAETYTEFVNNEAQRGQYTYDISELGKSIAENTRGAMAVYLRYNPDDYGATDGFWYTINLSDQSWQPSVPTDMSLYAKDDIEHVGWYYIPVSAGVPMWMDPYYNANLGVDMISYIMPYFYGDYTVGIIGMDISMDLLKEAVARVSVYENGSAFMMARSGDLIYHERYPNGISLQELPKQEQEYFRGILNSEMDTVHVVDGSNGTKQKLILKELKNGMLLGIYAPLDEIRAPQRSLILQQLGISAAILFLAILVCLIWVRNITNPLKRMTEIAEQYAGGDFHEPIGAEGKDEVGILSRSLQTMATSLTKQIEIADTANKAKSDFLANMSHEIRTPLNAVLGLNEMIHRETSEEHIRDYSTDIQSAGRTLLSLINSILDFSKIEDGKMEIIPVSYETASMINNLINSISERASTKGLELVIHVDEKLPSVLRGDDIRVTQVLMNLLTNAVKYTDDGQITFSVQEAGRTEDCVDLAVEVSDTGMGIRKEDIEKLAQTFVRLDEKKNRTIEGTGLGMSIVTRLLDMMGSELNIESEYGIGSSFSFVLRQQIVDSTPIGDFGERIRSLHIKDEEGNMPQMSGARILVVDDYEMNLKVASSLLKVFGIKPDIAASGQAALELMRKNRYHIVFLDHMMPQMDGIETLKVIKSEGLDADGTVIIALTANAIVGAKENYINAGFDGYLTKPIDMEALGDTLYRNLPKELISWNDDSGAGEAAAPELTPVSGEKDVDGILENAGISVENGLACCADSRELFLELLQDYSDAYQSRRDELAGYFRDGDWSSYQILIHAIKSTSRVIGADSLSDRAAELESASKKLDEAFIKEHHPEFIRDYEELVRNIGLALGSEAGPDAGVTAVPEPAADDAGEKRPDRIVVVDDDPMNLKLARAILHENGMKVVPITGGKDLLKYMKMNEAPDLILLDIMMPEMDGFQTIRALRKYEKENGLAGTPVIFLTADMSPETEARGLAEGALDFIRKPFEPEALIHRIRIVTDSEKKIKELMVAGKDAGKAEPDEMKRMDVLLEDEKSDQHALWLGEEAFGGIYRYMLRYFCRYRGKAYKLLFTLKPAAPDLTPEEFSVSVDKLGVVLRNELRNSDIMMKSAPNQYFLLLPMVTEEGIAMVVDRILHSWGELEDSRTANVTFETEPVVPEDEYTDSDSNPVPWVVVVDDDDINLCVAEGILTNNNIRVTTMPGGQELLDFIAEGNSPDLILLDVLMPGLDGFETMKKLRAAGPADEEIPVIFLTAKDDEETEKKGLLLGAMDFVKKPFIADVLTIRIKHIIELTRLQRMLSAEVEKKTSENEQMFMQVVESLASAIDAKDSYTNGHSARVAEYARLIAKRYGYSSKEQTDIYMIGLLHDVGKIGVPDEVINKPSKLSDEEFNLIKVHPVMGGKILEKIKQMPKLCSGAKWHHERYGGGGYPDSIAGDSIPEEARIIAVADAYDAMTSNRSYRKALSQKRVREEIVRGRGTQFDPTFADIMLELIDEDVNYTMRERDE